MINPQLGPRWVLWRSASVRASNGGFSLTDGGVERGRSGQRCQLNKCPGKRWRQQGLNSSQGRWGDGKPSERYLRSQITGKGGVGDSCVSFSKGWRDWKSPRLQTLRATRYFNLFGHLFPSFSITQFAWVTISQTKDRGNVHGYVYRFLLKI